MQTGFLFFRSEDVTDSSTGAASLKLAVKLPGTFENLAGSVSDLIYAGSGSDLIYAISMDILAAIIQNWLMKVPLIAKEVQQSEVTFVVIVEKYNNCMNASVHCLEHQMIVLMHLKQRNCEGWR